MNPDSQFEVVEGFIIPNDPYDLLHCDSCE